MIYLKQSTAVTLKIGPFLDDADGKTAETGLTIAQADVRLSKNGANIAQKNEATSCTHDELGIYGCPINATDTGTLGRLQLWVHESGALPVWHDFMVIPANVFDSLFSTDKLEVDLLQMGGVAQSATDLKDFADTGYDPSGHKTQAQIKGTDDIDLSATQKTSVNTEVDTALSDIKLDHLIAVADADDPVNDSIIAKIAASDGDWSGFDKASDALEAIRDRGDAAWITGGGGGISDIINVVPSIPTNIDIGNTKTIRLALYIINSLDDLPSTAEITPGTITIERSADGGTSWSAIVNAAACIEQAGQIYYDEVFDAGSGYASGDMIRITFKNQKITVSANDYEITGAGNGWIFHTRIDGGAAGDSAAVVADAVWDEILTGATHNIATSAGRRLREIAGVAILTGTAQAGSSTTITLAAGASATNGIFNRNLIVLVSGTGAGQTRTIADYNGSTKVSIIDRNWRVTPDATSEYQILADDTPLVVDHGVAQAGTSNTITLRDYASSIDDVYLCNIIAIIGGTGRGQARLVGSYNGTTKVITICGENWVTTPDSTSVYAMIPYGTSCASCMGSTARTQIADSVWDELQSGHTDAGSFGKYLDTQVSGVGGGIGSGALSCTWTQKDDGDVPMDNVQVWITTDEAGANVVAGALLTNANGEVTFMLDAGTYYVWRERGGYNFSNPQTWVLS
jgi:hypothetical protein